MEKKLTSVEVYFMVKELQDLLDAKIDQVYGDENETLFSIHKSDFGKRFLKVKDEVLYVIKEKDFQNETPSQFCTILRKQIVNSKIKSISQIESERIIDFELCFKNETLHLIIELFGGGNVLLLKQGIIAAVKSQKKVTARTIAPKEKYEYPKQNYNFIKITKKELETLLSNSNRENIVKTLALDLFLGGIYAEEVLAIAKTDKNSKSNKVNSEAIYGALKTLLSKELKPNKTNELLFPIDMTSVSGEKKQYDSFSLAIFQNERADSNCKQKQETKSIFDKKIQKLNSIIETQKKQLEKTTKESITNKEKGDIIFKNYLFLEEEIKKSDKEKIKMDLN